MNLINRNDVLRLLTGSRFMNAELQKYELLSVCGIRTDKEMELREIYLFCMSIIDIWKTVLCEEDRFLIQKHLIDALAWKRVRVEYTKMWNHESVRCERSMKRKQAQCIQSMANYSNTVFALETRANIKRCVIKIPTDY